MKMNIARVQPGTLNAKIMASVGYPAAIAALCGLVLNPVYAYADDEPDTAESGEAIVSDQATNASVPDKKTETVYLFANADGSVKNAEVSTALGNPYGATELADSSELTDIENVESDNGFTGSGSNMVWDAQGEDVYYKGNTDKEAPVSVKVTYYLDGKEVKPADLAGKSGRVKIRYDYDNTATVKATIRGNEEELYVPFTFITALLFDNDNFKNAEVTNGKIIDDGDRVIVAGYAMPGLSKSLGDIVDDFDIPEYFEVEADATDFEMQSALTIATAGMLDDFDSDDIDTSELEDASSELMDAMDQIIDGADQLKDGLSKLADGAKNAKVASGQLADGADSLADGSKQLSDGISAMKKSTAELPDGINRLYAGSTQIEDGLGTLGAGMQAVIDGIGNADDTDPTGSLNGALNAAKAMLASGKNEDLKKALESLQEAKTTLETLSKDAGAVQSALQELNESLSGLDTSNIEAGMSSIVTNTVEGSVFGSLDSAIGGLDVDTSNVENKINGINTDGMTSDQKEALSGVKDELNSVSIKGLDDLSGSLNDAKAKVSTANDAAVQVGTALKSLDVESAKSEIQDAANKFGAAAKTLQTDAAALADIDADTLVNYETARQLIAGVQANLNKIKGEQKDTADSLYAAKNGLGQLQAGSGQLTTGLKELKESIPALTDGIDQLNSGSNSLSSGAQTLADSLAQYDDAMGQLADGTDSAVDGTGKLVEGLGTFKDEGISQISDLIDDDLLPFVDRLDALSQAGKDYDNFGGITEGTQGSVKFVIETDAISVD